MTKKVKRIKTGAFERRFSLAKAGVVAGARYAAFSAGNFFNTPEVKEQRNKEILSEQAHFLVKELGKLKGSVVKVGQMMALMGEHFLPQEVTDALHTLEDSTTALEWTAIEKQLLAELGEDKLAQLTIDPEPIGAASLGQVHKAIRKSDGKAFALKIQYPGVASAIDSDMQALVQLLRITKLVPITKEFNAWLDEVHAMLSREVDYRLESRTTKEFGQLLSDDERYRVPDIEDNYCSDNIICTTFETGVGVSHPTVLSLPQHRKNRIGKAIMELCCKEVFIWEKMQTDPNFGNYLIFIDDSGKEKDRIILLDFGAIRAFEHDIIDAGKKMIRASYHQDKQSLIAAIHSLNFLNKNVPDNILDDFANMCFMAVEVLANPDKHPMPDYVLNENKEYLWGKSDLPQRILAAAGKNAFSLHFDIPPAELIFLARKLLGAYTFLSVIDAEVRGNEILDPFLTNK